MARKLSTFVHVADDSGVMHAFGPSDEMPGWAEAVITNPDVWEVAEPSAAPAGPDGDERQDGPPPKSGPGSGAPRWRDYAASRQVEVPADASREAVIAALDEAQVPTE